MAYQADQRQVTRTKLLETCKTSETGFTTHSQVRGPERSPPPRPLLTAAPPQVLGVSRKSRSVTAFTLQDGFIGSAVAEETHSLALNTRRSAAVAVVSR